jgi:mannose-6-phosphate isomerase-like protein (cupin superfamily)
MTATQRQPYVNTREDAAFRFLGIPSLIRATAETTHGVFGLIEQWEMPPEFASPYHTHHREDESFYVLEGEVAFVCGGTWLKAGPGTFVYGPREIAHGFKVIGNIPARMLLMCNPGGFEHFVLEQTTPITEPPSPPDMGRLMTLAAQYGIDIHGPLPEEPEGFSSEGQAAHDLKSLNLQWIQAFNQRDWKAENDVRSADFHAYLSGVKGPMDSAAWTAFMSGFTSAFPDSQGDFQGIPPTGRRVEFGGIEFNRFVNGELVEHRCNFDNFAMLQQIGAIPA